MIDFCVPYKKSIVALALYIRILKQLLIGAISLIKRQNYDRGQLGASLGHSLFTNWYLDVGPQGLNKPTLPGPNHTHTVSYSSSSLTHQLLGSHVDNKETSKM